jgi:antitoxin ParD1/3/4
VQTGSQYHDPGRRKPVPGACGQNVLFCTPRHLILRAHDGHTRVGRNSLLDKRTESSTIEFPLSMWGRGTVAAGDLVGEADTEGLGMNINLTPQLEDLVRQKVASGLYSSASEVVREALRLMDEKDRLLGAKLDQLRQDIREGLESGPAAPWDPDEIKREGRGISRSRSGPA